jgi:hypothetical protein
MIVLLLLLLHHTAAECAPGICSTALEQAHAWSVGGVSPSNGLTISRHVLCLLHARNKFWATRFPLFLMG